MQVTGIMWPGRHQAFGRPQRALCASLIVVGTTLGTLATVAPLRAAQAGNADRPVPVSGSAAPPVPAHAMAFGFLPANRQLSVEVTLSLRHQSQLTALLADLGNPGSPYYHKYLTPAQFTADFSPTTQQADAVQARLRAAGLTPGQVSANRLSIPIKATAAQLEHGFHTTLATYKVTSAASPARGRVAFANTTAPEVSAAVAPLVQGVIGLNDLYPPHSMDQLLPGSFIKARAGASAGTAGAAGPQPCSIISQVPHSVSMTALARYYGLDSLYALGDLGQGARVAILELEPNVSSDTATFEKCYGISTKVSYHQVDGGATGDPTQSTETPLDIETVAGLAPGAAIDVYQGPNGGSANGMYDIFSAFVTADTDKTLSVSWGSCEAQSSPSDMQADEALFEQASAQGQTILASAGDSGSTACYSPGSYSSDPTVNLNVPAGLPYVTSVGGTTLDPAARSETSWNESAHQQGASGGGISNYDDGAAPGTDGTCMPSYQHQPAIPGIISPHSLRDTAPGCPTGYFRQTPDVSADADPLTGYAIYAYLGGNGGWGSIGGTSASTPLWAAIAALTDASPYCAGYGSGSAGVLPQALYAAIASQHATIYGQATPQVLYDVTTGTNDYTPSGYRGGLYPATPGYDMATGLGTPMVGGRTPSGAASTYYPGYTALICRQQATRHLSVTSVSPSYVRQDTAIKVTIHGSGFLAVPGADLLRVFQGSTLLKTLTASCTTTACTVTLPAEPARTVSLEVSVEDGPNSKPLSFTYK